MGTDTTHAIGEIFRSERPRVLATLIRLLGDFELAEDAAQEAFAAALRQWPTDGVPANPRAWLISAGRFRGIDAVRRAKLVSGSLRDIEDRPSEESEWTGDIAIEDDALRLIFTCCHPTLPREAQVALTLREVCGLTTDEIARAFMVPSPTIAQRIVRAKAKIREDTIPFELPDRDAMPERLENVLRVTYLVFNEGYYASSGYSLTSAPLSEEAIRLGRLLAELMPESEVLGLLALMLLHESRRAARTSPSGDLVLLEDQDRSLWNRALIDEARAILEPLMARGPGPYAIQAAIAAAHAGPGPSDWRRVLDLYDELLRQVPSPVIELNRAVAVAMLEGPERGLDIVDRLLSEGALQNYGLAHAARADLCRRLGRKEESRKSYERALDLATLQPERRFLERRLKEVST